MEYVTAIVGLESYPIQHVQGYLTNGYRLFREKEALIVALMRGGEPMALGISQAFPRAMFLHAQKLNDICVSSLKGMVTVMLVDSVINTGDTILEFVRHIRSLHASIRIVVVAGVVQASLLQRSRVAQQLVSFEQLSFVALRISENSYTGKGPTDTGARLFCTVSRE
jgi:uracil phosphoribosyltransferase